MSQRTTTIIVTRSANGQKGVKVYFDKWGTGKKLFLDLMSISNAVQNIEYNGSISDKNFLPKSLSGSVLAYELEYGSDGKCMLFRDAEYGNILDRTTAPDWIDWLDSNEVGNFLRYENHGNDNGGMIVYINEKKEASPYAVTRNITAKWMLGTEDENIEYENDGEKISINTENTKLGRAFEKWLTAEEYANLPVNKNPESKEFNNIFKNFCNFFKIKID